MNKGKKEAVLQDVEGNLLVIQREKEVVLSIVWMEDEVGVVVGGGRVGGIGIRPWMEARVD